MICVYIKYYFYHTVADAHLNAPQQLIRINLAPNISKIDIYYGIRSSLIDITFSASKLKQIKSFVLDSRYTCIPYNANYNYQIIQYLLTGS